MIKRKITMIIKLTLIMMLTLIMGNGENVLAAETESTKTTQDYELIIEDGVVTAVGKGNSMITATCGTYSATCMITVEDGGNDNATPLLTTNKSGVLENPGQWIYYVDGKSKLYSTPTIDENDNISLGIETIDSDNRKYVFLRYQQVEMGTYNVTVTVNYAGTNSSVIDVTGGNETSATSWTVNNGDNSYNFVYTSDNATPFQLKFFGVGYYNINVKFEVVQ